MAAPRKSPKKAAAAAKPLVSGIAMSHPDKVLWSKTDDTKAVTKLDLARYYEAVADRMLPHIAGRPISVVRAPDGISGARFFQRHAILGMAAPTLAIKVRGEAKPFLGIENAKSLIALAQVGVLEIHPWGSKRNEPEIPERVIFDLDPAPGLDFARVIDGALELREKLTALGFVPFVKTTGGKGLHVVIAVKGTPRAPISWIETKAFAKAVAMATAADSPDRYTTTVATKARTGKIFIDYLRNDRTATGVAPWSPRARPGATIAVPLAWSQLRAGLDPRAFTIAGAGPLLRKPDAWAELARSAKPLATAMKKLNAKSV